MTSQISKIQLRRGSEADLPGATTNGLDVGEVAFSTDTNRLFIGTDVSTSALVERMHGVQNAGDIVFPYANVEVLTEFSPANQTIFDNKARNIQTAFITSLPMVITTAGAWATLMVKQRTAQGGPVTQVPFVIDAQSTTGQYASAHISYHLFDIITNTPMKTGRLTILHQGSPFQPILFDEGVANPNLGYNAATSNSANARYGMLAFRAVTGSTGVQIQYQAAFTGSNLPQPAMMFRVEQPALHPTTPLVFAPGAFPPPTPQPTPYDVVGDLIGTLQASETFFRFVFTRSVFFPSVATSKSKAVCRIAPTNPASLTISANGSPVGSITFAAGSTIGTVSLPISITLVPGDVLTLTGSTLVDPTIADISYTISGTIV